MRSCMGKFLSFMKGKIAVSKNRHIFSAVEKSIAYCTVADSFSFKFLHSRDLRRSSFASRCQDHTAGFKIAFRCFHLKGIKASHSHDLGIQDPDTKCPGLFKSSFKKFFSGKRSLKSVIILDLLCFFQ